MADGGEVRSLDLAPLLSPRREPTTPGPTPTAWRNREARLTPSIPPGWERWVTWALEPEAWASLRARLPPLMGAMMPRKPPKRRADAWRTLYEVMWLRATGETMLVPATRSGIVIGAYAAPIERQIDEWTIECTRAAPIVRLERSRYEGWRFEPEILRASFSDGPEGEQGERSSYVSAGHLGGDVAWDGVEPGRRRKPDKPGDPAGFAEFDFGSDATPPTTWAGRLILEVQRAKARILQYQKEGGDYDLWRRAYFGRTYAARVLHDARAEADVPLWITPAVVRYLLAVTSWDTGGNWQRSANTIIRALRSQKSFARFALRQLENVAVRHFDPTSGADNQHACDTLARAHEFVDVVMGKRRRSQVAFRMRLLELSTTSDPDRLAAREDLIDLYKSAIQ